MERTLTRMVGAYGWRRVASRITLILVALGVAGCVPRDPLEQVISVRTPQRFAIWRSRVVSDSSAETRARVEVALQEIRLSIAGEREIKRQMEEKLPADSGTIDDAVRLQVNGRRLRELLQHGFQLRVRRLSEELAGLEAAMNKNARLVTKPGDVESRHHLEGLHERQLRRVENYREEIAAAERALVALRK